MSIINYYIKNDDTGFDIFLSSDNMAAGVEFKDKIEKKSTVMENLFYVES